MSSTAPKLMTVEDLYELPDDDNRYELVRGSLISEPPPGGLHGRIAARLVHRLNSYVEAHSLGVVLTCDPSFVLHRGPDTLRAPDVAFVANERYDAYDDEVRALPGPPDLAIEVLSPSNTAEAIHLKVADFLAAGTQLVWIVDPERRQVVSYRSLLKPEFFKEPDILTALELLGGFELPVAEIFAR